MKKKKIENEHVFYNSKGEILPSVTTVLQILNKPGLMKWANYLGFKHKNYEKTLLRSATVGTLVHKFIEDYSKKGVVVNVKKAYSLFNDEDTEFVMNGYKSFLAWNKHNNPKIIHSELRLQNELYGGTLDNISIIDGYGKCLVDYKVTNRMQPTYFLQLSAYRKLYEEITGEHIDKCCILRMEKKHIGYEFIVKDSNELDKYYESFIQLYNFYMNWDNTLHKE